MASKTQIPVDVRGIADEIPRDIFERMSDQEAELRCKHVAELRSIANDVKDPAHHRALMANAKKVVRSLDHLTFTEKKRKLNEALSRDLDKDTTAAYQAALTALVESNPRTPNEAAVVDQAIRDAAKVSKGTVDERPKKALDRELAAFREHEAKCAKLAREIAALREQMGLT